MEKKQKTNQKIPSVPKMDLNTNAGISKTVNKQPQLVRRKQPNKSHTTTLNNSQTEIEIVEAKTSHKNESTAIIQNNLEQLTAKEISILRDFFCLLDHFDRQISTSAQHAA